MFYDFHGLLVGLSKRGEPQAESAARPHLTTTMNVFALFRGIDLARAHRPMLDQGGVCFARSRRKRRMAYELLPVYTIPPPNICPVRALNKHIAFTTDYPSGEFLLSLAKPRPPLSAHRVGALTTEFLKGLKV